MNDSIRSGFVYLISYDFKIAKIGMTKHRPYLRLKALQGASPVPLMLLHYVEWKSPKDLEEELHKKYAERRLHGEWFDFSGRKMKEVFDYFEDLNLKLL